MFSKLIEKIYAADTAITVNTTTPATMETLVDTIAKWVGIIAGALAFVFLLYSGILYVTANGNPDQVKKAQSGILNAIIGIIIIVLAYSIFTAIRGAVGGAPAVTTG